MRAGGDALLRILVGFCALALMAAFFQPWVKSPGGLVTAPQLRETLEGPHKLLSLFSRNSQVSRNYELAPWLWAVPASAGVTLLFSALPVAPALPGLISGTVAVGAATYLRGELEGIPLHSEARGVGMTERLGYLLASLSLLRYWVKPKRRYGPRRS